MVSQPDVVRVWEEEIEIPTYTIGPVSPLPPFRRADGWGVYPYPMQDDLRDRCQDVRYRAVALQNRYLLVMVLPELGGRIFSVASLSTGREMFYRTRVIKPGLVGLRGAWIPGGAEFNFPVGHSVTTFSPVDYRIEADRPDGSGAVWVGCLEHLSRMRWTVGVILRPNRAAVETEVRIHNRTDCPHPYYFWTNTAVPATNGLRFICAASRCRTWEGEMSFPVHEGRDLSLYRSHDRAADIFAMGCTRDDFGCYDDEADCGLVHIADHREVEGKKLWTWGTSGDGLLWADLLSDGDGPYCEVQSGRFVDQSTWQPLYPAAFEVWREHWWPVRGIGPFARANTEAALALNQMGDSLRIGVAVARPFSGARILLRHGRLTVYDGTWDVDPERPVSVLVDSPHVPLDELCLELFDADGSLVVRHERDSEGSPEPPPADPAPDSAEAICLRADAAWCARRPSQAAELYRKALAADPGHAGAHVGLGLLALEGGRLNDGAKEFRAALARNPDDAQSRYYLGVALRRRGDLLQAAEQFGRAIRDPCVAPTALRALAELTMADGRLGEAADLLRRALARNPRDVKALCLLSAALRNQGMRDAALEAVERAEALDPLDYLAAIERWMAGAATETHVAQRLRGEPQAHLEVAHDYLAAGLFGEAEAVLQACPPDRDPMVCYTLAFVRHMRGDKEGASAALVEAHRIDVDAVFPHRHESEAVLRFVLDADPTDGRAACYLGNLLFHQGRCEEAEALWLQAVDREPFLWVAHRNLGLWYHWSGRYREAMAHYWQATALCPDEYRLYLEADDLLATSGDGPQARLALLGEAPPSVRNHASVAARLAELLVALGRYTEALDLLNGKQFHPWEGGRGARPVYVEAHIGQGVRCMGEGDAGAALRHFLAATEYPTSLGAGRPRQPDDAEAYYLAGLAYQRLGMQEEAKRAWKHAAAESHHPPTSPRCYWRAASLAKLGERQAQELFRAMQAEAAGRLSSRPSDPNGLLLLGLALRGQGREERAREVLGRCSAPLPPSVAAGL
jgi:tetratricopeptide (TPR) repeat protein